MASTRVSTIAPIEICRVSVGDVAEARRRRWWWTWDEGKVGRCGESALGVDRRGRRLGARIEFPWACDKKRTREDSYPKELEAQSQSAGHRQSRAAEASG